jgi:Peptidase family M28
VAFPLLLAAFTVAHPSSLPEPPLPPIFDRASAVALTQELARDFPDRSPGSPGAAGAAHWYTQALAPYGLPTQTDTFSATIPGRGRVVLRNIVAVLAGRSPQTIVVMAHRDNTGTGPGANDNASGTAALIQLARGYARTNTGNAGGVTPSNTILFLSSDGGAYGALGADHFVAHSPYRSRIAAVINLDALAGRGPARLELAGDQPRSPGAALLATAAARIAEQTGSRPGRTSTLGQLIDLGFPFSLYEQAPFLGRGIPALTITTGADRPPRAQTDTLDALSARHLGQLGRAAESLLISVDRGLELAQSSSSSLYLGTRVVRGWAIELCLFAALLPFFIAVVDLFARCRRWRVRMAPALRSYRSRLGFWFWAGGLFELFGLAGVWPGGAARPLNPESNAATHWARLGVTGWLIVVGLTWLVARDRLVPRRQIAPEEELAGYTAALIALGVLALVVVATNTFALIFLLPSLHFWLWLPNMRGRPRHVRAAFVLAGFLGPLLLLGSFAVRFGLGLDAPWYLAELTAVGYVPLVAVMIALAWVAGAAQMVALSVGRYAPYPGMSERPRGPIRNAVRAVVLGIRARRRQALEDVEAREA